MRFMELVKILLSVCCDSTFGVYCRCAADVAARACGALVGTEQSIAALISLLMRPGMANRRCLGMVLRKV